jgi:hypothetical protein
MKGAGMDLSRGEALFLSHHLRCHLLAVARHQCVRPASYCLLCLRPFDLKMFLFLCF